MTRAILLFTVAAIAAAYAAAVENDESILFAAHAREAGGAIASKANHSGAMTPAASTPSSTDFVFAQYCRSRNKFFSDAYTAIANRLTTAFNSSLLLYANSVLGPLRYGDWHGEFGRAEVDFADQDLDIFAITPAGLGISKEIVTNDLVRHLKALGFALEVRPKPHKLHGLRFRVLMPEASHEMIIPAAETFLECHGTKYVTRADFFFFGDVDHHKRELLGHYLQHDLWGMDMTPAEAYKHVFPLTRFKAGDIDVYSVRDYNAMLGWMQRRHGYPPCYALPLVTVNKVGWHSIRTMKASKSKNCQLTNGDPVKWHPANAAFSVAQRATFLRAAASLHKQGYPNVFHSGSQHKDCKLLADLRATEQRKREKGEIGAGN